MKIEIEISQEEYDAMVNIEWFLGEMEKKTYFCVYDLDEKGKPIKSTEMSSDVWIAKRNVRFNDVWKRIKKAVSDGTSKPTEAK